MCNGLAVIAVKSGDGWDVYAEKGNSHHDLLLSKYAPETRDSHDIALRYELLYPFQLCIDLPDRSGIDALAGQGTITRKSTDIGCIPQPSTEATSAVLAYLSAHPELLEFTPGMLARANLYSANLHSADLSSADLSSANLYSANLYSADLRSADLRNIIYSALTIEGLKAAYHVSEALLSDDLKKILGL